MTNDKMHPSTRGYLEVRVQQWSDSGANTANLDARGELWPEATEIRCMQVTQATYRPSVLYACKASDTISFLLFQNKSNIKLERQATLHNMTKR